MTVSDDGNHPALLVNCYPFAESFEEIERRIIAWEEAIQILTDRIRREVTEESGRVITCSACDNSETILGEISEQTLADDGWVMRSETDNLCPNCA